MRQERGTDPSGVRSWRRLYAVRTRPHLHGRREAELRRARVRRGRPGLRAWRGRRARCSVGTSQTTSNGEKTASSSEGSPSTAPSVHSSRSMARRAWRIASSSRGCRSSAKANRSVTDGSSSRSRAAEPEEEAGRGPIRRDPLGRSRARMDPAASARSVPSAVRRLNDCDQGVCGAGNPPRGRRGRQSVTLVTKRSAVEGLERRARPVGALEELGDLLPAPARLGHEHKPADLLPREASGLPWRARPTRGRGSAPRGSSARRA